MIAQGHKVHVGRQIAIAVSACAVCVAAFALSAGVARGEERIYEYEVTPSTTQAGGHPDLEIFLWAKEANALASEIPQPHCGCQDMKNIFFDMPAGLVADPHALPQCSDADFALDECPTESQIGVIAFQFNNFEPPPINPLFPTPVYNLIAKPNQAGLIGFPAPIINSPVYTIASARTESDYGLNLTTPDITHPLGIGISALEMKLWGVPADSVHDVERLGPQGCDPTHTNPKEDCVEGFPSNAPPEPYLHNPTVCALPLSVELEVEWYDLYREGASSPFPATTGCDLLGFNPSLFGRPTTKQADTASGFDVDLVVPQNPSPNVPLPSSIRASDVLLPEGFAINANAADGKTVCTDEQANFDRRDLAAECPEFAKIGTLTIESASLPGPMPGFVYLAESKPGERYRLLLAADGFGLHVKLAGRILPNPNTGQVRVIFPELPQFPFSRFNMHLFGSERGTLVTPTRCGTYPVISRFTPWNSALPEQESTQYFTLETGPSGGPCQGGALPFNPGFLAGVADKTAGIHAPFSVQVTRGDGEQTLSGISIDTPPGFSATLKGIPYCPEATLTALAAGNNTGLAELGAPACPAASQVGTAVTSAGAGSRPVHVSGRVFLAGPYRGAPLSLAFVVPVVSGPYDLGNVTVRVPVAVDPLDASVTAVSDPLPRILEGIPLRIRSISINLDRPGFTLNPTNCARLRVNGSITGTEGAAYAAGTHFQVANCANLDYAPKLNISLKGSTKRRGHPSIQATLTTRPGEANGRRIAVTLPKGGLLDNAHIETICTRAQFAADNCPEGSRLGRAVAHTRILDQPLAGSVYLRASSNKLPDIVADLEGQIDVELIGEIDSVRGRLRTTFGTIPDAPVEKFTLNLQGGKKGLLINSINLCSRPRWARIVMAGQNGVRRERNTKLQTRCGNGKSSKRRLHRAEEVQ